MNSVAGGFSLLLILGLILLAIGAWTAYWGRKDPRQSIALEQLQQGWRLGGTMILTVGSIATAISVLGLVVVGLLALIL